MSQKSEHPKSSSERVVKDIRRATRRHHQQRTVWQVRLYSGGNGVNTRKPN